LILRSPHPAETNTQPAHIGDAPMTPLGAGVTFGDDNNDGWLDIYVTNQGGAKPSTKTTATAHFRTMSQR